MQKAIIAFLAVTTAVLSVVCGALWQQVRVARQKAQVAELAHAAERDARESQVQRLNELERTEARLEKQVQEFSKVTTTLRTTEAAQSSNLTRMAANLRASTARSTNAGAEGDGSLGKGMGDMLGKMMKDPAMREMLREQQKAVVKMMYAGLFKDLNLSPEESEKLRSLLTDAQMRNIETAQGLFGGDSEDGKESAAQPIAQTKQQLDEQIKALLGDERYAYFEDYQKSVGERMQLDQFKAQLAGENMPMRDEQSAMLLQIMKDEKLEVPPVIPNDQTQMPSKEFFTPEKIEQQTQWMDEYQRRLADRVKTANIFTPDQFIKWQTFQEQQISMQKLGLNMARQMFGGSGAPPPK